MVRAGWLYVAAAVLLALASGALLGHGLAVGMLALPGESWRVLGGLLASVLGLLGLACSAQLWALLADEVRR